MQQERGQARLADGAVADQAGGQGLAGGPAELGADEVHDARMFGSRQQLAGLGRVAREGLLAQHVLPGGDGLEHEGAVSVRRGGDGDGFGEGEGVGQRRAGVGDIEALGPRFGLLRVASDEGPDIEPRRPQGPNVGEAAEARAHNGHRRHDRRSTRRRR